MNAYELDVALRYYLEREPDHREDLESYQDGNGQVTITAWKANDKPEPTIEQLEQLYDDYKIEFAKICKVIKIKQKANGIIINKFGIMDGKQNNLQCKAIVIIYQAVLKLLEKYPDAGATAIISQMDSLLDSWDWVQDIRSQSDTMESELDSLTLEQIENYEINFTE